MADNTTWCTLAYWELRRRVGPLYAVRQPHVDVFTDQLALGSGLCLSELHRAAPPAADSAVLRARRRIGAGVVLARDGAGPAAAAAAASVWLYNRSRQPVFVARGGHTVDRVAPGHCLPVSTAAPAAGSTAAAEGPRGPRSVQVSFGKGFGSGRYSRRSIHSCPCWIEILLGVT